jgi:hypothetical protein
MAHDKPGDSPRQADIFINCSDVGEEEAWGQGRGQGRFDPLPENMPGPAKGFMPMHKASASIDQEALKMVNGQRDMQGSRGSTMMKTRTLRLPLEEDAASQDCGEGESSEVDEGEMSEMSFDLLKLQPEAGGVS